jgi:spoIIIJ-associated protein
METDTTPAERAKGFLEGILERMSIEAEVKVDEEDDRIVLDIVCDQAERVIGRRGQVVDALQHLVGKMTYRDRSAPRGKPIVVDADGYRAKTIERLESLAQRMADKALETKEDVELNPMSPHDRRIVHMALAEVEGVTTRSEGTGDRRRVIVIPEAAAT